MVPSAILSLTEILKLAELLEKTAYQLKFSVLPQLPLELLIVQWCQVVVKEEKNDVLDLPKKDDQTKENTIKKRLR